MKQQGVLLLFFFGYFIGFAQNQGTNSNSSESYKIIRSSLASSGSSNTISTNDGIYNVSASIGQSSVIGTSSNEGYVLRQGYQQLSILSDKTKLPGDNKLNTIIYPNPFQQSISVSFNEQITNDIFIDVFNVNGRLVFSKKFPPSQLLKLRLGNISNGTYVIKVASNGKQFSAKLIKN